ncbi:hypothetical protein H0H92_012907 [Tricholoma furcatifolium]|nr:hypothetical protein H0H92_012907 [Tricholoma furcatifolium]
MDSVNFSNPVSDANFEWGWGRSPVSHTVPTVPPVGPPSIPPGATAAVYASVDPFRDQSAPVIQPSIPPHIVDEEAHPQSGASDYDYVMSPYMRRRTVLLALIIDFLNQCFNFFSTTLPRNIYLVFLLGLPSFYFSRVARIFDEADMTMPEIENMALEAMVPFSMHQLQFASPAGANLKATWESFIDSLLREWKTFNIVSALLLSLKARVRTPLRATAP